MQNRGDCFAPLAMTDPALLAEAFFDCRNEVKVVAQAGTQINTFC
jgi:hypothetical protein